MSKALLSLLSYLPLACFAGMALGESRVRATERHSVTPTIQSASEDRRAVNSAPRFEDYSPRLETPPEERQGTALMLSAARLSFSGPRSRSVDSLQSESLETLVKQAARLCGTDQAVTWSIALRESSGQHWDRNGNVLKSTSAAWGVMQIKLGTARDVSPSLDIMDPWQNALAGACHFRKLMDEFGDTRTALHAYHAGQGTVWRRKVQKQTRDYADSILGGIE